VKTTARIAPWSLRVFPTGLGIFADVVTARNRQACQAKVSRTMLLQKTTSDDQDLEPGKYSSQTGERKLHTQRASARGRRHRPLNGVTHRIGERDQLSADFTLEHPEACVYLSALASDFG
jgi:hypothetical protein